MSGSSPEPEAVTASGGTLAGLTPLNFATSALRCCTSFSSVGLFGPRLDAPEKPGSQPSSVLDAGFTAFEGRGWKYCGSGFPLAPVNSWQIRLEPTTLPW